MDLTVCEFMVINRDTCKYNLPCSYRKLIEHVCSWIIAYKASVKQWFVKSPQIVQIDLWAATEKLQLQKSHLLCHTFPYSLNLEQSWHFGSSSNHPDTSNPNRTDIICVHSWLKFLMWVLGVLKSGSHVLFSEHPYTLLHLQHYMEFQIKQTCQLSLCLVL